MNLSQHMHLSKMSKTTPNISVSDLGFPEGTATTLLYGYTIERNTFHVYLKDEMIHVHIYNFEGATIHHESGESLPVDALYPNKRVYPERSLFTFVMMLRERGGEFSLTTFQENVEPLDEDNLRLTGCVYSSL